MRLLADFHVRFRLEYLEPPAMLSGAPVGKLLARDGEGSGHILPPVLLVLDHAHRAILGRSVGHLLALDVVCGHAVQHVQANVRRAAEA